MASMDAAERFAAAREGGEAVVSSGRQPSHAGQSRKKSLKTMKVEARLMPTHTQTTHVQPIPRPSSVTLAQHSPGFCCLLISLDRLAVLVLGLAGVGLSLWSLSSLNWEVCGRTDTRTKHSLMRVVTLRASCSHTGSSGGAQSDSVLYLTQFLSSLFTNS